MPRGIIAPCSGCDQVARGKQRVRIGGNLEGYFCATCAPLAREAARLRFEQNARRWRRSLYLATRRAA